jgi:hypothetical protein
VGEVKGVNEGCFGGVNEGKCEKKGKNSDSGDLWELNGVNVVV